MPKTKISEYSATANSNTDIGGINVDEGCAPSGINDAIRTMMAQLKNFQTGTGGDSFNGPVNGTVGATTPAAGAFTTLTTSSTVTHNGGTANGVAYLNGSKVLTTGSALVFDGSNLGLGVTPSAWASGSKAINVGAWGTISSNTTSGNLELTNNAYQSSNAGVFTYANTQAATRYAQALGIHQWQVAASGTAGNTISFTQAMTLDASGNLGIGTTSPLDRLDIASSGSTFVNRIRNTGANQAAVLFQSSTTGTATSDGLFVGIGQDATAYVYQQENLSLVFGTNNTERARIDSSGNLLVGTTTFNASVNANLFIYGDGGTYIGHASSASSGAIYSGFYYNGGSIGSITQNGTTGVLYNLTSDYRLKNNLEALTGAKDFVMALQPKKWQWWDGSGEGVGFVAHEFMEVAKYSGQGEKDAVDAEGKPLYQSIQPSSSEVMANLVAHIQNLETRLAALESN